MADRTMADVRRLAEQQEPFLTIRASDPNATAVVNALARHTHTPEARDSLLELATRMRAWLNAHQYELLQTTVLQAGPPTVQNPLGQCVIMVKLGVGPRRDHPTWRIEHRLSGKFRTPEAAMSLLYGGYVLDSATFGDDRGWTLCDSRGDPITRGGD